MAGHSKWAKIKRAKGANDAKKAVIFGKLCNQIIVAVKTGGGSNPELNFKLKSAIDKAKTAGVPNDTIKRAIEKGDSAEDDLKEVIYEGYLPDGVAVMVITATNNTNRTYSDVRSAFTKGQGSLGTSGCVAYMFNKRGEIHLEKPSSWNDAMEEELLHCAIEAGADDLDASDEDELLVLCATEKLEPVVKAFEQLIAAKDFKIIESKEALVPNVTVAITKPESVKSIMKTMDLLDDNDDVVDVIANFDIAEDLIGAA